MMTIGLRDWCRVMYVVTKPLWDWYTDQTTHCKTPEDALRYNIDMAKSWRSASQIRLTFEHSLYDSQALQYCLGLLQSEQQIQKSVHGLMSLSWAISSERLWSFAARHCTPLDCYADFFEPGSSAGVVARMLADAQRVYSLDACRFSDSIADQLWKDAHSLHGKPVRLVWALFERDGPSSRSGTQLLLACVQTLADNKAVEELHFHLKSDAKKYSSSQKQSASHLQHIAIRSKVLESHYLPHAAALTKDVFVENWHRKREFTLPKTVNYASTHCLPAEWSNIMGAKSWRSTTEVDGRASASAWHWIMTKEATDDWRTALLSRWLLPGMVFTKSGETDEHFTLSATMGRGKWSTLTWPLVQEICDGNIVWKFSTAQEIT